MGIWTQIFVAALMAVLVSTGLPRSASAQVSGQVSATPSDPLQIFSVCLGRTSAEWSYRAGLSDTAAITHVERMQKALGDLVAALTPQGGGVQVRAWRLEARAAHGALLSQAAYRNDAWAARRAAALIDGCAGMVLLPPLPGSNAPAEAETEARAPAPRPTPTSAPQSVP